MMNLSPPLPITVAIDDQTLIDPATLARNATAFQRRDSKAFVEVFSDMQKQSMKVAQYYKDASNGFKKKNDWLALIIKVFNFIVTGGLVSYISAPTIGPIISYALLFCSSTLSALSFISGYYDLPKRIERARSTARSFEEFTRKITDVQLNSYKYHFDALSAMVHQFQVEFSTLQNSANVVHRDDSIIAVLTAAIGGNGTTQAAVQDPAIPPASQQQQQQQRTAEAAATPAASMAPEASVQGTVIERGVTATTFMVNDPSVASPPDYKFNPLQQPRSQESNDVLVGVPLAQFAIGRATNG
jgi:hypothetical protein